MNFASENYDGTHPKILQAIVHSNKGFAPSYGKDVYTEKVTGKLKEVLKRKDIEVFFCFNGTGANNFAISSITERHNSVFCSDVSHLYTAESTAPETFTGCRLFPVKSIGGKIMVSDLVSQLAKKNGVHFPLPATLSITQPTEYGTVYSLKELREIATFCKQHRLLLHIDGARIFNALAALDCSFAAFVKASGADAITIGGTKSGLMVGEAVVLFKSQRFKNSCYNHKRSMQLASKNRFIAVQFEELFRRELWKTIADHSNGLARYFGQEMEGIHQSVIAYPVETNMVFMNMKLGLFRKLRSGASFYRWDTERDEVRFVFSYGNTKKEIDLFLKEYKKAISKPG